MASDSLDSLIENYAGRVNQMDSLDAIELLMAIEETIWILPSPQRIEPLDALLRELRSEAPTLFESMVGDTTDEVKIYCEGLEG